VLPAVIEGENWVKRYEDVSIWCWKIIIFGALVSSRSMECSARVDKIHVESMVSTFEGDVSNNYVYVGNAELWKDFSTIWRVCRRI
jgi:hypothetical protein